jgi:hypothetical protein
LLSFGANHIELCAIHHRIGTWEIKAKNRQQNCRKNANAAVLVARLDGPGNKKPRSGN